MTTLIKSHFEKLLLILVGVALLLSAGWCWRLEAVKPQHLRGLDRGNEGYQSAASAVRTAAANWSPPVAQPAGADWVFEIFSPPLIHRDAGTGGFAAGMPLVTGGDRLETGIKLLAIRAAPYRVQLQGGFGPAAGYVAAVVAVETHEVWCARPGERWAAMEVVLEKIEVGIDALARDDPGVGVGYLARATVRDEKTGRQVMLVAGVPTLTHELLATVRLTRNSKTQNLREGDICEDGEFAYRVDRLSLNPVVVAVVTKMESGREADETLLLRPDASDAGDRRKSERAESSSHLHSFFNRP